ncbi:hypothetical protein G9A89_018745 [Geosiphon pyriformis]|nr:hypothetical protein G9A89_018745 [Geosiphon pyriformis]
MYEGNYDDQSIAVKLLKDREKYQDYLSVGTEILQSFNQNNIDHILEAIQNVHNLGIRHRDLRQENILWKETGEIIISDWGV